MTFLRRDRWNSVAKSDCYPPLLPNPLDITTNVAGNPPIFLNEHWLASGRRAPASIIKLLNNQVDYLMRALEQGQNACSATLTDLFRLAQHASSAIPNMQPKTASSEWVNLAEGKPFVLSSYHAACPNERVVMDKGPYFFHTAEGRNEFITIDLEAECRLFELLIRNRSNVCQERARCLFYCALNALKPDLSQGFPVSIDESFIKISHHISVTNLRGCQARYLTIFSPEKTLLHLAAVKIFGKQL